MWLKIHELKLNWEKEKKRKQRAKTKQAHIKHDVVNFMAT